MALLLAGRPCYAVAERGEPDARGTPTWRVCIRAPGCYAVEAGADLAEVEARDFARRLNGVLGYERFEVTVCAATLVTKGVERRCLDPGPHLAVHLWEPIEEARERSAGGGAPA